jgi:dUTP pyrophosphatase
MMDNIQDQSNAWYLQLANPHIDICPSMTEIWDYLGGRYLTLDSEALTVDERRPYTAQKFPYIAPESYATEGSVGLDLPLQYDVRLTPGNPIMIDLGFRVRIPKGWGLILAARSGVGGKSGITPRNCIGIIDSDYRGNLKLIATADGRGELQLTIADSMTDIQTTMQGGEMLYRRGKCLCQAVLMPLPQATFAIVETLDETSRSEGGFNSTNR